MKQITIIVERTNDMFSCYAENVAGIYGGGETLQEAKKSVMEAIELYKKYNSDDHIPELLIGEFTLAYKFDVLSFLNYYKGVFTPAALEKITGINQKQIQHYSTGHRKPRAAQRKKIEMALHKLGEELISVQL